MEEFRQLSVGLHENHADAKIVPRGNRATEKEVVKTLQTCRETVEQLLAKCCASQRIGQLEYKGVRDFIGAAHIFLSAFHPPSKPIFAESYALVNTLLVALTSEKVHVESQILFSTALIQLLISGPCPLSKKKLQRGTGTDFCRSCLDEDTEALIKDFVTSEISEEPTKTCGRSLLFQLVTSDFLAVPEKTDGFELSLCYAFVMSSSRLRNLDVGVPLELLTSPAVYGVIFKECSKYSKQTTMAFKTLASWLEKVSEFGLSLSTEVTRQVFTVVTSSWEIALSGIRKDNSRAFSALLSVNSERKPPCLPSAGELLDAVVRQQMWTDVSKFYIITELVGLLGALQVMEKYADEMTRGLIESFQNNQLAAGGGHLFEALLRQLKCAHWERHFLQPVLQLIDNVDGTSARYSRKIHGSQTSTSLSMEKVRTIQLNILNYWLRITANIFPDALIILREITFGRLALSEFQSEDHLSFLAAGVLHLSRKKGIWNPLLDPQFKKIATYRDEITSETYFKSLCASCKISDRIQEDEFQMIMEFLKMHVNVDSPRTRQEMIKSMNVFFYRFHVSMAHQKKAKGAEEVFETARKFLSQLMSFLSENLTDDSFSGKKISYQRRITSLLIYSELVRSLNDMKNFQQRNHRDSPCAEMIRSWHSSLQQQDMLASCLDDQTDNIQNTAFCILRESINEIDLETNSWLLSGIKKCQNSVSHIAQSGLFYTVLGSQLLYHRLKTPSLIDDNLQKDYTSYKKKYSGSDALNTPVTLLIFNIGLDIFERFKTNPMELTKSKSLHGVIDGLSAMALKEYGVETGKLHPTFQEILLNFVEDVANFCVSMFMGSSENKDCAPSFAEMGIAIKNAAKGVTDQQIEIEADDMDDSSINTSADERLLVKHLWLNLKACCNFAANVDGSEEVTQKCLNIIVNVLRRCRHKGAIETAGESLQSLISRITRVPKFGSEEKLHQNIRALPMAVLRSFLEDLAAGRTANETSITRRSAGLAIFVHHIVIGDADPEKPLLKVAMAHLMVALNSPITDTNVNEKDLPQAQTLHILRTLVADASLRVTITPYVNNVAQSALVYLTSTLWSVRNGALQLFGALVPILVGQELSLSQFYFHNKELLESLLSFMGSTVSENSLRSHNDAVPAVVLLSRLSAPPVLLASQQLLQMVQQLNSIFFKLLGSPVMTVRRLAACGIARMSCIERPSLTVRLIKKWAEENVSQNAIHGSLLAINSFWERCQLVKETQFYIEIRDFLVFLPAQRCSVVSDLISDIINKIAKAQEDACGADRLENLLPSLKISTGNNIERSTAEEYASYFKKVFPRLDLDYTRIAFETSVHLLFENPSLAEELLPSFMSFLSSHPTAPNDILISALSAIQQTTNILMETSLEQSSVTDSAVSQLYHVSEQWMNTSVRATLTPVLLGLLHLIQFECTVLDDITESAILEIKQCCSFVGDRDHQNHIRMTEALVLLAPILAASPRKEAARDFIRITLWFLQSEDSEVRDSAAEVVAPQRLSHTECVLKLLDPEHIRAFCKDDLTVALSLCDNLLFSDDELLQALSEICDGCNTSAWLRENPYVEDWYIADTAFRHLDRFLEEKRFSSQELSIIDETLQLNEHLSFINKCKVVLKCEREECSAERISSVIKTSSLIQSHRKSSYRARMQEKCRNIIK